MSEIASPSQIKITWLIGTLAAFAIFAAIGGYSARMTETYTDYDADRAAQRMENLKQVQDAEGKLINPVDDQGKPTAKWIDQDKGIICIPITEAMAKEVDALKAQPVAAGCEIPGTVPAPAPAPTPASTNAAPVAPAKPGAPAPKPKPDAKVKDKDKAATPAKPKT